MASLHEYFVKDGSSNLTLHETWSLDVNGTRVGEIVARLHFDFEANAKYVSFYFPDIAEVAGPEAVALNKVAEILRWPETKVGIQAGLGAENHDGRDLVFTGQIYLYSERAVPADFRARLEAEARAAGHKLTFRSQDYVLERGRWERPRAFISHDSRDKARIAEPLAVQLQQLMCPVWYDQFSLRVGDSLRESIEKGLKECSKCVLILTPNFLSNGGWSKREYDSIFTREIVERQRVILPLWDGVSAPDVYEYSPILADRVAVQWSLGKEEVARRLFGAIDS
jgi:hypothetical protein